MPRKTLLEVVSMYLTKSNGFKVQSIFDSDEAESAANIAEEVFYIISEKVPDIQFMETLVRLDHSDDTAEPNYLKLPQSVTKLHDNLLKYNYTDSSQGLTDNYRDVKYLDPRDFLDVVSRNTNKLNNVQEVTDPSGVTYTIPNNRHPMYFTSFDGINLAFDSYNSSEDATLQSSKSIGFVSKETQFLIEDNFYIPLPDHLMQMYQDGVVAECSESLRQEPLPSVRRRFQAQMAKLQQTNRRVGSAREPRIHYGRRRRYG